jgi:hypothetical protein
MTHRAQQAQKQHYDGGLVTMTRRGSTSMWEFNEQG